MQLYFYLPVVASLYIIQLICFTKYFPDNTCSALLKLKVIVPSLCLILKSYAWVEFTATLCYVKCGFSVWINLFVVISIYQRVRYEILRLITWACCLSRIFHNMQMLARYLQNWFMPCQFRYELCLANFIISSFRFFLGAFVALVASSGAVMGWNILQSFL